MYDKFDMTNSWTPGFEGKTQSSGNRILLFLVILFALCTVALAVVLAVTVLRVDNDKKDSSSSTEAQVVNPTHTHPTRPPPTSKPCPTMTTAKPAEDVCLTEGCVLAAARVRNAMDPSIQPCDDFYQFACGSWLKQNVIPEDKSSYGSFTQLRDDVSIKLKYLLETENKAGEPEVIHKAKDYYKACANEEMIEQLGLDFILNYMEALGGWPIMGTHKGGNWNRANYNLEDLMILVRNETNTLPFVDIYVAQDDKNPTKYILTIDQTSLGMPSRDYYLKGRNDSMLLAYQKMRKDLAIAFGADPDMAEQDAKDLVDFEIELANITMRREDRRDPEKLYNKMTLGSLGNNFTGFDWIKLAKGTFHHIGMEIDENEPVIVVAPPYFEKFMEVINKYPSRVIANYLVGNRIWGKTFYLPAKFTDIKLEYQKALTGSATRSPRWQSCSDNAVSAMSQVVGRLFIEEYFKKEAKDDVLRLIENLRVSVKEMISEVDWMEDSTKQFAKDKADYIEPRIGYPDWVHNETRLAEKYELVTVDRNDPLATIISFNKANVQKNLKKLRKDYDKSEWGMSAATVNAYYSPSSNQITFPAAILQPPFYDKDQPSYLNYGGIGYVIGHEITHGFDDQGRLYDKNGNLKSWWTDADTQKFKARAQCMIDQYSSYVVPGTGNMTINGITTQGENIADNGGLKESFMAYRKFVAANGKEEAKLPGLEYSGNQLYFVNAAQIFCEHIRNRAKIKRIRAESHSFEYTRRSRLGTVRDHIQKRRILVFLLVLFIILDFALIIGLIVAATKPSHGDQKTSADDVCLTEGCVSAAARVRSSMDPSASPCDDFYQFACGSWLKENVIPEDKSRYGIIYQVDDEVAIKLKYLLEVENKPDEPEVIHKARDYYKACVNEERIEQLGLDFILDYMEKLGGWPIITLGIPRQQTRQRTTNAEKINKPE